MGFFKRILSLGSKKSKRAKARQDDKVDSSGRIAQTNEPWQHVDKEATRLLRSSSAHFSVVPEVDYSSLPPLREPYCIALLMLTLMMGSLQLIWLIPLQTPLYLHPQSPSQAFNDEARTL